MLQTYDLSVNLQNKFDKSDVFVKFVANFF
jgi:hypothetical protein